MSNNRNEYEVVVILHPATPEDEQATLIERIKGYVSSGGGEVASVESGAPWGRRTLAYPIRNMTEGYYSLMRMNIEATALPEFERNLKLMEPVLRYSIIRA